MSPNNSNGIRPLDGIRVVSLEHAVAAPFATRQLADLGARVIKIERPGVGDFARGYDQSVHGQASYFVWLNRGKESLTLDLKDPEAQTILHRLLADADVLVQNLAPGAAARMGLDFDSLHGKYDKLIVCDISGYGDSGPYRDKKAYDLLIQAAAGLVGLTGGPNEPSRAGVSIADISAGMYAYSGILSALLQRGRTGKGLRVQVTMLEAMAEWMNQVLYFGHYGGKAPARFGASHPTIAPYGVHRTGDGSVIFSVQNEREFASFCEIVLGNRELAQDERFSSNTARVRNRPELTAIIEARFASMTVAQAEALLDEAQIANAPMNDIEGVWNHPQLQARQRWREVATPGGPIGALLPPANLSGVEPVMGDVPALGAHSRQILAELGYAEGDIAALADKQAI
ncbi:CaiB/BaiF CoA transferase family protein [Cupriavidus oxalaticus]|uniref:CoA transferase n=1 Tax=Cupriavidus oxalaticus TaxID=96344 RepID=A0A375G8J9_9BURK|nr:CaiB/BaiF CoA-transferase family protein [Cupriavidus oxalaticus]QRQ84052.1 CoA transferase [Cupriavidus oxalaticus]QRQ91859.1 CoA transferase [Cupriavidus oxalaticus]WQD86450.1 CaiB/BaiF CoA-transferase family protein [Cupriavidus oxalaticus]SPC17681.1 Acyl-CoA transferase/carnitine dehydratase [Cupriavidus oxalaticus]